jgi:hypothetical protein
VTPLKKILQRSQASKLRGKRNIPLILYRGIHGVAHRTAHLAKTSQILNIGPSEDLDLDVPRKAREGCRFTRLRRGRRLRKTRIRLRVRVKIPPSPASALMLAGRAPRGKMSWS